MKKSIRKIDLNVIFEPALTFNDFAIYLSILGILPNGARKAHLISSTNIFEVCGIVQQGQSRSLKKLERLGFIKITRGRYQSKFKINRTYGNYITIEHTQFDNLISGHKAFTRRMRAIVIANGKSDIPRYRMARTLFNESLSYEEYYKLKRLFQTKDKNNLEKSIALANSK